LEESDLPLTLLHSFPIGRTVVSSNTNHWPDSALLKNAL